MKFLTPQSDPSGSIEVALIVPSGTEWEALARGALALLLMSDNYEQAIGSSVAPDAAAQWFTDYLIYTFQGWTS